ncbi:MAG: hemerythrin domain-containing protein [Acidimicrobiales bacterium]
MDAITLLKEDHHTVAQLFTRFERAGDEAYETKRKIVDRIIEELSVHAAIEELVFYPTVRREVKGATDMALESLEEHHIVKWLLSELEGMDPHAERFEAKVTVLIESVRHHVEEEETDLFPKVRDQLSRTRLAELGDRLAAAKKTAPTHPHPRSPDTPPGNVIAGTAASLVDKATDAVKSAVSDTISMVTRSGDDVAEKVSDTASEVEHTASRTAHEAARATARTARQATTATTRTARKATDKAKPAARKARASKPAKRTTAKRTTAKRSTAKRASSSTKRAESTAKRSTAKRASSSTKRAGSTAKKAPSTAKKATIGAARTARKATTSAARTTNATAKKATSATQRTTQRTAKRTAKTATAGR